MVHKGSVNCLAAYNDFILTASADHTYRLISTNNFKQLSHIDTQDMIFAV
jgi:WD40 repeat protein